ncbi:MAG: hypothetical protein R8G33_04380 [Gammaproteobacteria bacterium]|nr:hypothetical protein [Gammaproteobacteria bacterium]
MNTILYSKSKSTLNEKSQDKKMLKSKLTLTTALTVTMLFSTSNLFASNKDSQLDVSNYAYEILVNTEQALNNMTYQPKESLSYVTTSLDLIEKIESNFTQNTLTETNQDKKDRIAHSHTHYLPKLDLTELKNNETLPILKQKIKTDVVYKGESETSDYPNNAWFDYTFAKASLVTVREALNAGHSMEAIRNLKRVYEAIYIEPDFNVSEQSS